ncbi:hypothetical protein BGS_0751 [Beggiatoa sp. SS]|nr:hypothetical protein BGS_0751 [Beggiatoa sp. SS]
MCLFLLNPLREVRPFGKNFGARGFYALSLNGGSVNPRIFFRSSKIVRQAQVRYRAVKGGYYSLSLRQCFV